MIYVVVIVLVIEVEDVLVYHISVYVSYILIIKQNVTVLFYLKNVTSKTLPLLVD